MRYRTQFFRLLAAGALLAAAFMSCTKASERMPADDAGLVRVRIYAGGVESGAMTRSNEGVEALLAAAYPAGVSLRLINAVSGIEYQVRSGDAVLLPIGAYSVTGRHKPQSLGAYNGSAYVAREPAFQISAQLEVVEGVAEYSVPVAWDCFALCCDTEETKSWKWYAFVSDTPNEPPASEGEGEALFFVCGSIQSGAMRVALQPYDLEHYAATDWWVSHSRSELEPYGNAVLAQSGRWYRLHPDGVVTESGSLALGFPAWVCGAE